MFLKKTHIVLLSFALTLSLSMLTGCDSGQDLDNGQGLEIVANNTEDSGEGTLRQALEIAEAGDTIIFDPEIFSPDDPAIINIQYRLPGLDQGSVTIDASDAGVILNGAFAGGNNVNGLEILSSNNTIRGLQIINFQNGAGIALSTEAKDNLIGGDQGTGAGPCGQGNQLSANKTGISLAGSSVTGNIITGNLIGTNENGQRPYRNIGNNNGITISDGASANTIGEDNIIAFNKVYGVHILGNASESNTITRNSIFSNGSMAISLEGGNAGLEAPVITEFNINSGTVKGSACKNCIIEVFSSNGREGKFFEGDIQVDENGRFAFSNARPKAPRFTVTVTDAEGNTSEFSAPTDVREIVVSSTEDNGEGSLRQALREAGPGDIITFDPEIFPPETPATIYLERGLPEIQQSYLTLDASNAGVIIDGTNIQSETYLPGLIIESSNNIIMGLQIINFKASPPGQGAGITIRNFAQDNIIGGDRSKGIGPIGQGNLLSENDLGIDLAGSGVSWNVITGNLIGADTSVENQDKQNGNQEGIIIDQGASKNIIGPDNLIAFNIRGVVIAGEYTLSNTITQNSIHSNIIGIMLEDGGNTDLATAKIVGFNLEGGIVEGIASANTKIEIFSSDSIGEGKVFEGMTYADEKGHFTFTGEKPLEGLHVTATITDSLGNTSSFSAPGWRDLKGLLIQAENNNPKTFIETLSSHQLADNRIGGHYLYPEQIDTHVWDAGLKWVRVFLDPYGRWQKFDWGSAEYALDTIDEHAIENLEINNIKIILVLDVIDHEYRTVFFKSNEEIEQYLTWVRFMVEHFKERVEYYEILNEPDFQYVDSYVNLIKQTIPIIRKLDPEAKIVIGALCDTRFNNHRNFMWGLLESEVMPLVEGFSWHGMYGAAPSDDPRGIRTPHEPQMANYWENYPALVEEIKRVAVSSGFEGKYLVEEMLWRTHSSPHPEEPYGFTDLSGAKYYARAILMHLGLDVAAGLIVEFKHIRPQSYDLIQNLCTIMAGHEAIAMPVEFNIDYNGPIAYCTFRYPDGDRMLAVWTDDVAVDEDPGVPATIIFPGLTTDKVTGIDVLHGLEQTLIFTTDGDTTVVKDVLVKDYPILIRLNNPTMSSGYDEMVGDGFHRLER